MARKTTSPLSILLSILLLFATNVFAVSAVLGVDLGTEFIKAALVKPGIPLEIVLTKDSRRKETSAVLFKPAPGGAKAGSYPERAYGSDALAVAARFPGDVYPNLKTLLGLPADSAAVKEYAARHPALQLEKHQVKGTAAFKSAGAFTADEEAWLVEELLAMELQSIRANAEVLAGPGSTVRSVVLTVPPFYTTEEKRAVELAADLAGLKVLSLISDGLAVGLHYATSRQFPNINDGGKPEHHMIFDMGAGSTKATVLKFQSRTVKDVGKFNKTVQEVQVLGSGWDRTLGGDSLNYLIIDDMVSQFADSPKAKKASVSTESVKSHGRAIAKLTREAERLRHVLSANANTQASFEGLYEDIDFKYKITRAAFEEMAADHAERVGAAIQSALTAAGLELSNIDSVILHGGASRTPFVQKALENALGSAEKIRTNVNSDEAAVFGAGFRAADISPSFRVKEIRVSEGAAYPAGMKWKTDEGKLKQQRLWTAASHLGAVAKDVTLPNKEDVSVDFYQVLPDGVEAQTKLLTTKNLTATVAELVEKYACEKADIHFKIGVRLASENGEVDVTKATVECEAEEPEKETFVDGVKNLFGFGKKDQQPLKEGEEAVVEDPETSTTVESSSSTTTPKTKSSTSKSAAEATESADAKNGPKGKKLVVINVDYVVTKTGVPQIPKADILALKDRIKAFEASDKSRRQREEALNQLESFTYTVRDLLDSESFVGASTSEERATLEQKSSDASDWVYGEGAEAPREELRARLKELQEIVDKVKHRVDEATKRPGAVKDLKDALNQTLQFVAGIKEQIATYEEFKSAESASSLSSTSTSAETSTVTAAPSAGDFDGLEDDAPDASTTTAKPLEMEDVIKERGPVPPLYTLQDLKESEDLYASITAWLEEQLAKQEVLGATDDPVLTIKELTERREKLDKAGVDLAMKAVRNFEGKKKTEKKAKKPKSSKTKTAPKGKQTIDIRPDADGNFPTEEQLEEMLREFQQVPKESGNAKTGGGGSKPSEEKPVEEGTAGEKHDEL